MGEWSSGLEMDSEMENGRMQDVQSPLHNPAGGRGSRVQMPGEAVDGLHWQCLSLGSKPSSLGMSRVVLFSLLWGHKCHRGDRAWSKQEGALHPLGLGQQQRVTDTPMYFF
jgi:hypothetical protein